MDMYYDIETSIIVLDSIIFMNTLPFLFDTDFTLSPVTCPMHLILTKLLLGNCVFPTMFRIFPTRDEHFLVRLHR